MLSIVIVGRNDNYGGNFIARIDAFQQRLTRQVENKQINVELIIVEWNPIPGEKSLHEVLNWIPDRKYLKIRIVTVLPEVHNLFGRKMPVLEYLAKNVGIRRAEGDFVLTTNPDVMFSDNIMDIITGKLNKDFLYTVPRYDVDLSSVPTTIWSELSDHELSRHAVSICSIFPMGIYKCAAGSYRIRCFMKTGIDFSFIGLRRFIAHFRGRMPNGTVQLKNGIAKDPFSIAYLPSGDFMLAAKDMWIRAGGFFEELYINTHLDSLGCLNLIQSGAVPFFMAREIIFHIEHVHVTKEDHNPLNIEMRSYFDKMHEIPKNKLDWGGWGNDFHEQIV